MQHLQSSCSSLASLARLAFAATLFAAAGCGSEEAEEALPTPSVRVYEVGERATGQSRRVTGRVEALDQSALSFGVGGRIAEIIVGEGAQVTKGQLIARLDDATFKIALDEATSQLAQARAGQVEAATALARARTLKEKGGASQQELDAATLSSANGDAQVSLADSAVARAQLDLSRTSLTAPFSGRIVSVDPDAFQEIGPTETIALLQTDGALKIEVLVPESLIRDVYYGQAVQVTSPTTKDQIFPAIVALIAAEALEGNAYQVTAHLSGDVGTLRPGMTASVAFSFDGYLDGVTAYLIPLSSIAVDSVAPPGDGQRASPARAPVFLYDKASRSVTKKLVTVGDLRGNRVEILEGIQPGDLIVSAGVAFLRDGMQADIWTPRK